MPFVEVEESPILGTMSSNREVAASSLRSIVRASFWGNLGVIVRRTGGGLVQGNLMPEKGARELNNHGCLQRSKLTTGIPFDEGSYGKGH